MAIRTDDDLRASRSQPYNLLFLQQTVSILLQRLASLPLQHEGYKKAEIFFHEIKFKFEIFTKHFGTKRILHSAAGEPCLVSFEKILGKKES